MFACTRTNTILLLKLVGILRFEDPARAVATQKGACNAAQQARSQAAIPSCACDGLSESSRCHHLATEAAAAVCGVVEATREQSTSCSMSIEQQIRDKRSSNLSPAAWLRSQASKRSCSRSSRSSSSSSSGSGLSWLKSSIRGRAAAMANKSRSMRNDIVATASKSLWGLARHKLESTFQFRPDVIQIIIVRT